MNQDQYIFSQLMALISHKKFQTLVNRHSGDHRVRDFSCWKQFLCMAFGQLTHRESLTDTMLCLKLNANKLYHLGIGEMVSLSTISRANENRSYRIYQELATMLMKEAQQLYSNDDDLEVTIPGNVFAIDATTIDLCLSSFYWATFRSTKAGIKLHTQIDLKTSIPKFIAFTNANVHDVNVLDVIHFEPDSFYVMDRGYIDYKRFYKIHLCGAFFVSRTRDKLSFRRLYSNSKDKKQGILYDQSVKMNNFYAARDYPEKMRIIKFKDETGKVLVFMSNNFKLPAADIAQLYKHRWKIELFFKWIKQNLKIKSFWGQSENAVKTQVWIGISTYLIVAIAKKKFMLKQSLYEILQILSISIFEKMPINQLFQPTQLQYFKEQTYNQLKLFDL